MLPRRVLKGFFKQKSKIHNFDLQKANIPIKETFHLKTEEDMSFTKEIRQMSQDQRR